MDLPDYVQLSKWLSLFGENIAVGMIVVVLYAAVGPTIGDKRPRLTSVLSGAIFASIRHRIDQPPLRLSPRGSHRHARRVRPGGQRVRRPNRRGGDVRGMGVRAVACIWEAPASQSGCGGIWLGFD